MRVRPLVALVQSLNLFPAARGFIEFRPKC